LGRVGWGAFWGLDRSSDMAESPAARRLEVAGYRMAKPGEDRASPVEERRREPPKGGFATRSRGFQPPGKGVRTPVQRSGTGFGGSAV